MKRLYSVTLYSVLLIIFAALTTAPAHALQFELGAGLRQYQAAPNGIWYQRGFGYNLNLTGPVISFGLTGQLRPWLRYGVRYLDLGSMSSNSTDTPSDQNYLYGPETMGRDPCAGTCWPLANYVGHGSVQGVALTLQPQFRIARHLYSFVEAGLWVYLPKWTMNVYHWCSTRTATPKNLHIVDPNRMQVSWTAGTGVRYRNTSLAFDVYGTRVLGTSFPSVSPMAYTIMLRQAF
ncbi:MAG: hypothetical protein ACYCOU_01230 [Sulfobacillus sp.]